MFSFGPNIKHLREKKGLSRSTVLKITDRSAATLSRIESGKLSPSWELASALIKLVASDEVTRARLEKLWTVDSKSKPQAKYPNFGAAIKGLLDRMGLTAADVAENLGVSQQLIYLWKEGASLPGGEMLMRLASLLEKSWDVPKFDVEHLRRMHTFDLLTSDPRLSHLDLEERRRIAARSLGETASHGRSA